MERRLPASTEYYRPTRAWELRRKARSHNAMRLPEANERFPDTAVFEVTEHDSDDFTRWQLAPLDWKTVRDLECDAFYILKAWLVLRQGQRKECYLDLSMPERIEDHVYFYDRDGLWRMYPYHTAGDVIPAVAIERFGIYELFYSRRDPEVGLEVLRGGLPLAARKAPIAEDMGYILRDESRVLEAIEAFSIAIREGPTSYFTYLERADLYEALGDHEKAQRDRDAAAMMEGLRGY
jgi:tetratricopeptide (TPR) repeat protein